MVGITRSKVIEILLISQRYMIFQATFMEVLRQQQRRMQQIQVPHHRFFIPGTSQAIAPSRHHQFPDPSLELWAHSFLRFVSRGIREAKRCTRRPFRCFLLAGPGLQGQLLSDVGSLKSQLVDSIRQRRSARTGAR